MPMLSRARVGYLILMTSLLCCSYVYGQTEGLVHFYSNMPMKDFDEDRIWFKDSAFIIEVKKDNTEYINDRLVHEGYDVYKYSYVNLKNGICQDYFSFSDTASVRFNYRLKANEFIRWNFYSSSQEAAQTLQLSDSTIAEIRYKRYRTKNMFPNGEEYVYFLAKSKDNIFHLNKSLDAKSKGWKVVRADLVDSASKLITTQKFMVIRDLLNEQERNVFKAWEENAKKTRLREVSLSETFNEPMPVRKSDTMQIINL